MSPSEGAVFSAVGFVVFVSLAALVSNGTWGALTFAVSEEVELFELTGATSSWLVVPSG